MKLKYQAEIRSIPYLLNEIHLDRLVVESCCQKILSQEIALFKDLYHGRPIGSLTLRRMVTSESSDCHRALIKHDSDRMVRGRVIDGGHRLLSLWRRLGPGFVANKRGLDQDARENDVRFDTRLLGITPDVIGLEIEYIMDPYELDERIENLDLMTQNRIRYFREAINKARIPVITIIGNPGQKEMDGA